MNDTKRVISELEEIAGSTYGLGGVGMTQIRRTAERAAIIIEDQRRRLDAIASAASGYERKDAE